MSTRYWIIVASKDHVRHGVAEGFAQACHGKASPIKRMHKGDGVVYYSSKVVFGGDEQCQCFTAIGEVEDDITWQAGIGGDFEPYRRRVHFLPAEEAPIRPLIPALSFIADKRRWGGVFRFGMLEIPRADYERIAVAMRAAFPGEFAAA